MKSKTAWYKVPFKIFASDIKGICRNWVAVVIIIGLIIIPSLYAWINILASTDPYGNTSGIKVAVVSMDKGGSILGNDINVGDSVIDSLKEDEQLGWTIYEDEAAAIKDTELGKVYAAIIIPEDFSEKICAMLDNPQKPELKYYVNMKKNAIAPKMTQAGAKGIQNQIKETLIDEIVVKMYTEFNRLGDDLSVNYDDIESFVNFVIELEPYIVNSESDGRFALNEAQIALDAAYAQKSNIERIRSALLEASEVTKDLSEDISKVESDIKSVEPELRNVVAHIDSTSAEIASGAEKLLELEDEIEALNKRLAEYQEQIDELLGVEDGKILALLSQQRERLEEIRQLTSDIQTLTEKISDTLTDESVSKVYTYLEKAEHLASEADWAVNYGIDVSERLLDKLELFKEKGDELISIGNGLLDKWALYDDKAVTFIESLKEVSEQLDLRNIIELLKEDAETEGDFFSSPIELDTHELFPTKNYGAAMTPFYTVLCLWVGALILCALLTMEAKNADFPYTLKQEFFGKWLLFVLLAVLQGLVVALGDIFILGIEMREPLLFVLLSMFYSLVFVTIVYTFVAQLGNVGKAIGVILLVIQIAGSGGTFPIEVTPQYFQNIYGVLPFTYAIGGMREAVAGVVPELLQMDMIVLLIYLTAFILLGLISKHWIRRVTMALTKKLNESGVTES